MDTSAQQGNGKEHGKENGKSKKTHSLDTRVIAKDAKKKSRMYLKVQEIGSHVGQVSASLQNFVFNHIEESEREIHMKRMYLTLFSLLLLIVLGVVVSKKSQAETAMFYPSSCLGGWTNVAKATGKPDADEKYTNANSAMLPQNTAAELFCGGFAGEIPENKDPKVLILRIAWSKEGETGVEDLASTSTVVGSDFASSSGIILDATGTPAPDFRLASSTEATSTETIKLPAESTSSPQSGIVPSSFMSLLKHLFMSVYAQEETATPETQSIPPTTDPVFPQEPQVEPPVVEQPSSTDVSSVPIDTPPESTTTPENALISPVDTKGTGTTTEQSNASTSTAQTTTEEATSTQHASSFFEVEYTFDGVTWNFLGGVSLEDLRATQFEIPIPENVSWDDLSKLQIHVKRVENADQAPTIFLDGMTLEVEVQDLEGRKREQVITNVVSTSEQFAGKGGVNGDAPFLLVMSSSTYGVVLYDASSTQIYRTQAAQNENAYPVDTLPYGNYILVATNDLNWCANQTYEECTHATSTYVGEVVFTVARPIR